MGLLNKIIDAATESSSPIADLLRSCKILANKLKHQELSDWANRELNGYEEADLIPDYRILKLSSPCGYFSGPMGSALNNVPIPVSTIPKNFRDLVTKLKMKQSIVELDETSKQASGKLHYQWTGDMISYMQHNVTTYKNMILIQAYSDISFASIKGIVETVRTKVLDYALAIQSENPEADKVKAGDPPPIKASILHQTFNTKIFGGQANVLGQGSQLVSENNIATSMQSSQITSNSEELGNLLDELLEMSKGLKPEEQEEAISAHKIVKTQLEKEIPNLEKVKNYLEIISKITVLAPVAQKIFQYVTSHL